MSKFSVGGVLLALYGLAFPSMIWGQGPVAACDPSCAICPPAKQICTCTTLNPVVDTRYHKQQVVNYQDVKKTCYRQEQYSYCVPVTKFDCVTVDEGHYQTIWVPKPVVKQVPRTEYQQRVGCRTVPYEVTQRVPHVSTICVPEHRVRYVPGQTCTSVRQVGGCAAPCGPMPGVPSVVPPSGAAPCHSCTAQGNPHRPTPDPSFLDTPSSAGRPGHRGQSSFVSQVDDYATGAGYTRAPSSAMVWQTRR